MLNLRLDRVSLILRGIYDWLGNVVWLGMCGQFVKILLFVLLKPVVESRIDRILCITGLVELCGRGCWYWLWVELHNTLV